jgi:uncharacterized membrane protein YdjX (TVP38/TMEM64 family)
VPAQRQASPGLLRGALSWAHWWPSLRSGVLVVALFAAAVLLVRLFELPIRTAVSDHAVLGVAVFVVTSVLAVLMPMLTNLPLLPVAVLAWGPWWTATLLWLGWIVGASLSFWLARRARAAIVRRLPSVQRHAQIDRLIDPRHRIGSLVLLRMTFPVDVLSYALGLFSPRTTLAETALSTALGAAPFAVLFALFPTWSLTAQALVGVASVVLFALYALWVTRRGQGEPAG